MRERHPLQPSFRSAVALLLATTLGVGLTQSTGAQSFSTTYGLTTTAAEGVPNGTIGLQRSEGKLPESSAFMPGAKIVNYMYATVDPATGNATLSGYKIFVKGADSVVEQYTSSYNIVTLRGEGRTTFLSGTGAFTGIKGEGRFTIINVKDAPSSTINWEGSYTVNPKR